MGEGERSILQKLQEKWGRISGERGEIFVRHHPPIFLGGGTEEREVMLCSIIATSLGPLLLQFIRSFT